MLRLLTAATTNIAAKVTKAALAMANTVRIATHSGTFHADEALACYMLRLLPEYKDGEIVRSRNPDVLSTATVTVDVGGEYDPARHKYDHHQKSFSETFSEKFNRTPLSSAGLVYKHFGKRLISQINKGPQALSEEELGLLHEVIYESLIEAFDGIDNGVDRVPRGTPEAYKDRTSLANVVGAMNDYSPGANADELFAGASRLVGEHFVRVVDKYVNEWLPARGVVRQALQDRHKVHASGRIFAFDGIVPWKRHTYELETELGMEPGTMLYAVYPDESAGTWRMQAVPESESSFESRLPLPDAWRGLRDAQLDAIVNGVPGAVFVHQSGFTGGHKTREGAIDMCVRSMSASQ